MSEQSNRSRGLSQLKGSASGLGALTVALLIGGIVSGSVSASDVDDGGALVFAQTAQAWWITAGLAMVARAIVSSAYWRLASED